ncbi:MAG: type II 3-dehydroquinate dehydratase [Bacteroidota bacterium]
MLRIAIINGPNLNLVGIREPGIYGSRTMESLIQDLIAAFPNMEITYRQSNVEGELINFIQEFGFDYDGIILNPGGYTHTSVAIADAVAAIKAPVIEVHISNIKSREEQRHISLISKHCLGMISGLGLEGYELALDWFEKKALKK